VNVLAIHENKLYSGNKRGGILVWNTETYEAITSLSDDSITSDYSVRCLIIHNNILYSGIKHDSWPLCRIRIWNTETHEQIYDDGWPITNPNPCNHYVLNNVKLTGGIHCFTLCENELFSGGGDETIRFWANSRSENRILKGHTKGVICLTSSENKLYSGSDDNTIRVWKINNNPNVMKRTLKYLKTSERGDRKRLSEGERKEVDDDYVLQSDEEWATDDDDS